MVFSNVIADIAIFRRLFVFSQLYVQISASLTNVRGLAVAAFDLVYLQTGSSIQDQMPHDSEDDFRSGRNVSHCQQQQFFSELY